MPARCFLMALKGIKWLSDKNQSSDKCLYFQTPLSVTSLIFFLSINVKPQDSSNLLSVLSWQLGHTKVIRSTLKFVVSCCVVSWEWAFEWRRCFTGLIFSKLVPTMHRCEITCQEWNRPSSLLHQCIVEASSMVEKAVLYYKADTRSLNSRLLHCLSLALCKFRIASDERCKGSYGQCVKFAAGSRSP